MQGRIFDVAVSDDGRYLAAVATLDQRSTIRVWAYDVEGQIPDPIKLIQQKNPSDRSEEEKQALEKYVTPVPAVLATWEVPETAIYSIAIDRQGRLAAGGADGQVRVWSISSSELVQRFDATPQGATVLADPIDSGKSICKTSSNCDTSRAREAT